MKKLKYVKIVDNVQTKRREYYNVKKELIAYEPRSAVKDWGALKHA